MAANDKAGAYLYFDQGYSEAAATVQTLIDNAMRLILVGTAMFLLASMLFLLLFARRTASVMRSMRLLGVPKRGVWLESLETLLAQELTAVLLGNVLATLLYDRITTGLRPAYAGWRTDRDTAHVSRSSAHTNAEVIPCQKPASILL